MHHHHHLSPYVPATFQHKVLISFIYMSTLYLYHCLYQLASFECLVLRGAAAPPTYHVPMLYSVSFANNES